MRSLPLVFAALPLVVSTAGASDNAPQEAIKDILTGAKGWAVFVEWTPGETPSDRATTLAWEFQRQGAEVKGRTTNLGAGLNCEFDVVIRENGFDVSPLARGCNWVSGPMIPLDYDPKDSTYPFKRLSSPQKLWLSLKH